MSTADPTAERTIHTLRSSNLPFYRAVWTAAKRSSGLVAFHKRFYWDLHPSLDRATGNGNGPSRRRSALVDIVARNGEEWIKVSTVTATRLLFERARAGWEDAESSSGSEQGEEEASEGSEEEEEGVGLVKLAEDLRRAAMAVRVRYRHPRVRFVLPKIREGDVPEVDEIIEGIRRTGAIVQCQNELESSDEDILATANESHSRSSNTPNGSADSLHSTFLSLQIDHFSTFTPTLNIDCTILLALVSDLSHGAIPPEPWFHRAIKRQIELEAKEQLLPSSLWPAMGSRDLVCTAEAATRMREIVDLIGTEAEKVRTRLLMGEGGRTREELVGAFAEVSEYEVPAEWRLPIKVVEKEDVDVAVLPVVAKKVAERLTAINRSVFLYGWASGRTTISSNRTVAKLIESVVEENRTSEDDRGPDVWLCPTARSLVGKEKGRRG